ncbi:TrmH family RNA methyltransferase [Candidatus Kaiserbacteria bacterium]|nr:TrmH family RNA methyltransferase [Candidatus Kaiserbacteria bacterium]
MDTVAIFHDVRSAYNVGSLFRTADGAHVARIYLTGYTPAPTDRFGREVHMIVKTALGAEKAVPWEKGDIVPVIKRLKSDGYRVVGVEQTPRAVSYRTVTFPSKTAYLFGNEVGGLHDEVLKLCDSVIMIPMGGKKESLNVAVVAGIILFHFAAG